MWDEHVNPEVYITVVTSLPKGYPEGTFSVRANMGQTFRQVLSRLCNQTQVHMDPCFMLRTYDGYEVPMDLELHEIYSVQLREHIYWCTREPPTSTSLHKCWNAYWFMGLLSIMIASISLAIILYVYFYEEKNYQYAVIFDAGSSHTSMYIYKWEGEKINSTAVAIQDGPKCNPKGGGISSYAKNASQAGQSLVECLDSAKNRIPSDLHGSTSIYLGATAGMRLLQKENPSASTAVLESIRNTFSTYPFKFTEPEEQVLIIPGSQEGAFGWITSNYITGTFDVHPQTEEVFPELYVPSVGTMDLGGASTQITFIPNMIGVIPDEDHFLADLYGTNYSLYTHSFLCYGINEATRRHQAILIKEANHSLSVSDPCAPKGMVLNVSHDQLFQSPCVDGEKAVLHYGYAVLPGEHSYQDAVYTFHGESNATVCQTLVADLFNFTTPCPHPNCSFNGVFQPPVSGDFYGISFYFYVMDFLNLTTTDHVNYTEFSNATQTLCAKDWQEVKHMKTHSPGSLPWYCFQSLFVDMILVHGYGFDPKSSWNQIHFVDSIGGVDVGWTLGFIIYKSYELPASSVEPVFSTVTFILLIVLLCAFFVAFFCFARLGWKLCKQDLGERSSFSYQRIGYGTI